MNRRGVIISGGQIEVAFSLEFLSAVEPEYIIGVDRGLEFLYNNQVQPTHIVGDFDSISEHVIQYYQTKTNIPIRKFPPEKDATDTEIAVRLAIELGVKELWIMGATGTRLDHVWGNVQTLKVAHDAGIKAFIVDAYNRISLIEKEGILRKEEQYGEYFSVFPLGGEVLDFTMKGAKYPLNNHTLVPYNSLSVSNQVEEEEVRIIFPQGLVVLMETREKPNT